MSTQTLFRWSAVAAVAAGVVDALYALLDYVLYPNNQLFSQTTGPSLSQQATTSVWLMDASMIWFAHLLLLFAIVGLYCRQASRARAFGFAAFLVAFIGAALEFGTLWSAFILNPPLAKAAPAFLDSTVTQFAVFPGLVGFVIPFVLLLVGWLLFVVASLRAKVFPRWALLLSVAGFPCFFLGIPVISDLLFGAGLVGMGYFLWAGKDAAAPAQKGALSQPAVPA
jgi:hypothetical protein